MKQAAHNHRLKAWHKSTAALLRMQASRGLTTSMRAEAATPSANVLVVGGGFAGLSAAKTLTDGNHNVVLIEQGRGLGGRVCTRSVAVQGQQLKFDHGCQYLSPKAGSFATLVQQLVQQGIVESWDVKASHDGYIGPARIGEVQADFTGRILLDSFKPGNKQLYVGVPSMSTIGRHIASTAGPNLKVCCGTRAQSIHWDAITGSWSVSVNRVAQAGGGGPEDMSDLAQVSNTKFDYVITAMSSVSTGKLLTGVAHEISEEAELVKSNVCWCLMVALRKPTGLTFEGALITNYDDSPIAWISRDSSKPQRTAPHGGECWVVHASPKWSNERRDLQREDIVKQLLFEFFRCCGLSHMDPQHDVLHTESHRWNNAYPLNPRPPMPIVDSDSKNGGGMYRLSTHLPLGSCGDWLAGPRAGDAWESGRQLGHSVLQHFQQTACSNNMVHQL